MCPAALFLRISQTVIVERPWLRPFAKLRYFSGWSEDCGRRWLVLGMQACRGDNGCRPGNEAGMLKQVQHDGHGMTVRQ